ncbi:unnamed protein product [Rangifer tarandus platyrhynchus]|uniref:Uncharacterized protein n=1 Tax=Rangifer tarandus platyrhynchus TaxID=3082113 RepID=A0AC59YRN0_RANTA
MQHSAHSLQDPSGQAHTRALKSLVSFLVLYMSLIIDVTGFCSSQSDWENLVPPHPQGQGKEVLGTILGGGDGLLLQEEVRQHLGNPAGGVADVRYGEVAEEEVHGQLESGVQLDQDEDEPVAQQGQQIDGPKQDKQASLGLPVPKEAQ